MRPMIIGTRKPTESLSLNRAVGRDDRYRLMNSRTPWPSTDAADKSVNTSNTAAIDDERIVEPVELK